jgi:hypothetical protein
MNVTHEGLEARPNVPHNVKQDVRVCSVRAGLPEPDVACAVGRRGRKARPGAMGCERKEGHAQKSPRSTVHSRRMLRGVDIGGELFCAASWGTSNEYFSQLSVQGKGIPLMMVQYFIEEMASEE